MDTDPSCALCGERDWTTLGERAYHAHASQERSEYIAKRFRVLFELWFPGKEEVTLTNVLCRRCGFVSNRPRPESADIDAKYRLIAKLGQDYGASESEQISRERSRRLFEAAPKLVHRSNVLDFGGGDGRLMAHFAEYGHHCYLIDYNDTPQPFVEKLADTVTALDSTHFFDLIICNNVLEHVASPVNVVRALAAHLSDHGALFVQVPMEIWRRPPLHDEPVTHVNFFVPGSLQRCLQEAGMKVAYARLRSDLHPSGYIPAVHALAGRTEIEVEKSSGFDQVRRYLSPRFSDRLRYAFALREKLGPMLAYKFKRLFWQRTANRRTG